MERRAFRACRDVYEEPGMRAPWRPLVLAAALNLIVVAAAAAQTVIVTKAPPGGTVELVVNSVLAGTAAADSTGMATFALTAEARGGKTEADAYVFVEYCDALRRVILIEPGMQGLPGGQCPRREVPGAFVVRQVTTLVVSVSETAPSVLVRQGKAPAGWLTDEVDQPPRPRSVNSPTRGLYGFGAGGIASLSGVSDVVCGSEECSGGTKPVAFSAGATFWLKPFVGIEASWLKPADIRLTGATRAYEYVSTFQTDVFTMVGKLGVPVSYVRPYGFGGATWNRTHWTTTETIAEQTYTIDGAEVVYPGGTQTFNLHTQGWSWIAGAGIEVAFGKRALIFGEGGSAGVKGEDRQLGEGKTDQRMLYIIGGIRIRILG
jgi:opacity protein-like surface antigen